MLGDIKRGHHGSFFQSFIAESFSATFVSLIPKKAGAKIMDFCPISLGIVYKIISKVFVNRLKISVGEDCFKFAECIY